PDRRREPRLALRGVERRVHGRASLHGHGDRRRSRPVRAAPVGFGVVAREYPTVLELVGSTPIVRLDRVSPPGGAQILAKLEYLNPGGSVKDRIGLPMIEAAEREGKLRPGGTIVEPTSGNTG